MAVLAWIAILLCCSASAQAPAAAQVVVPGGQPGVTNQTHNGIITQLPNGRPFSRRSNLSLTVDARWASNYGYRPIKVTVRSLKPTTSDQVISIRLHTTWWSSQRGSMSVEQEFEMPGGSTVASAYVLSPQYQLTMQGYWWEVWVDGVKDRDLSLGEDETAMAAGWGMASNAGSVLSILVVGPDVQQRWLTMPNTQEFEALSLPAGEFPKRWLEYSCFDAVSLSLSELRMIAQSDPEALAALRLWGMAGGQIWINDTGVSWEHLSESSKILGVPATILELTESEIAAASTEVDAQATKATEDSAEVASRAGAWRPVRFGRSGPMNRVVTFLDLTTGMTQVERDPDTIDRLQGDPNFAIAGEEFQPDTDGTRRRLPRNSGRWFVDQPFGLGTLRAFRGQEPSILFPAATAGGGQNAADIAADRNRTPSPMRLAMRATQRWGSRHGMKPDDANVEFATLLVPGVGLAPVTEFRVLITLFVLLIGPVNYWVLKRFGRLHLLVLTVPLAAALMTSALFGYAILSDGFGTTVRAHSVTTLDQRTGEAACWSRLSYYAGLAPGNGLTLPDDVAIYPIIPDWSDSSVDSSIGAQREMRWQDRDAELTRGWLRSRTPTQYLTIRARKTSNKIVLAAGTDKIRAENKLGARIEYLLVTDKDGRLFVGENVDRDATRILPTIKREDAIRQLRQLLADNAPSAPAALTREGSEFLIFQERRARNMAMRYGGQQRAGNRLGSNVLNSCLADLAGTSGRPALNLPPKSYVAVTETGPEVVLGIPNVEEQASFHVLIGRW